MSGINCAGISARFVSQLAIISRVMGKPRPRHVSANASCDLWAFRRNERSLAPRLVINALFELLQHLDRSAELSGCRCLHGQTWMPCECLRVEDCRCALFL